jgi:competence protein ComEA
MRTTDAIVSNRFVSLEKESSMQAFRTRIRASAVAVLLVLGAAMVLYAESSEPAATGPKVNINTATAAELSYLPRLGPKVAARIVEHRKEKPFARPEELMEVKGIGEKLFVTLKPYVAVSGPTTLNAKVRSSASSSRRSAPASAKEKSSNTVPSGKGR